MNEPIDLTELRVFAAVAARRSFIRAATALAMPKATVSRKVQALEARLGLRLLQRTTRRVSLTEAGEAFLDRCQAVEEAVAEAEEAVTRLGGAPRGTLRVTCPFSLAAHFLTPGLPRFLTRWPEVRVQLTLKNEREDLVGKGVDVALSPWPPGDGRHVARLVAVEEVGLYASPAYLARRGTPRRPDDLAGHAALQYTGGAPSIPAREWQLARGGLAVTVPATAALAANDFAPLLAAALAGAGLLPSTHLTVAEHVQAGRLVRVLPEWSPPRVEVRALLPGRAGTPPKVRAFVDFLLEMARELGVAPRQNAR